MSNKNWFTFLINDLSLKMLYICQISEDIKLTQFAAMVMRLTITYKRLQKSACIWALKSSTLKIQNGMGKAQQNSYEKELRY